MDHVLLIRKAQRAVVCCKTDFSPSGYQPCVRCTVSTLYLIFLSETLGWNRADFYVLTPKTFVSFGWAFCFLETSFSGLFALFCRELGKFKLSL